MEKAEPGSTGGAVAALATLRRTPLDRISADQMAAVVGRIVSRGHDQVTVDVASFDSSI